MKVKVLDSIYCEADAEAAAAIRPYLKYEKEWWKQGQYAKEKKKYPAYMIKGRRFLTGFLPTLFKSIPKLEVEWGEAIDPTMSAPYLDGITFHKEQLDLISRAVRHQRGVIKAATGFGKTIVALGLMSMFPNNKILFLSHSIDITNQTIKELEKYKFFVQRITSKDTDLNSRIPLNKGRVCISTIQSFAKLDPKIYCDYFDITIIDEAHHCNSLASQYGKVMTHNLSPMKIGFTATLDRQNKEKVLTIEGLIGPVIGEMTASEAVNKGLLAKPTVKLIPVPYSSEIAESKTYKNLYKRGIIFNRRRNRLIQKAAEERITKGETVLIIVKDIIHGDLLNDLIEQATFIQGKTDGEMRLKIKETFKEKKIKCVICTTVWREGINIPSLNCTINACGMKSEIMTIQFAGRGLRKTEDKDTVELIDFLDPYRYLAEHTVRRLQIYVNEGWM